LRVAQLLDVCVGAEPALDLTVRAAMRDGACLEPAVDAVSAPNAEFRVERAAVVDRPRPGAGGRCSVVGVKLIEPAISELFIGWQAGVSDPLRAQVVSSSSGRARPKQMRNRVYKRGEQVAVEENGAAASFS